MRRWTRRSSWYQPRLRRFARSLPGISSSAPSARWRRTSIGGEFAASRGGYRTAAPSAGGPFGGGRAPPPPKNTSLFGGGGFPGGVSPRGPNPPPLSPPFLAGGAKIPAPP